MLRHWRDAQATRLVGYTLKSFTYYKLKNIYIYIYIYIYDTFPYITCYLCEDCKTNEGPNKHVPCVFPFTWQGKKYNHCIPWPVGAHDVEGYYFCSTQVNAHVNLKGSNWGFCSQGCPGVPGR